MFKKLLLSLLTLGAIGGSGTGVYYSLKNKNQQVTSKISESSSSEKDSDILIQDNQNSLSKTNTEQDSDFNGQSVRIDDNDLEEGIDPISHKNIEAGDSGLVAAVDTSDKTLQSLPSLQSNTQQAAEVNHSERESTSDQETVDLQAKVGEAAEVEAEVEDRSKLISEVSDTSGEESLELPGNNK